MNKKSTICHPSFPFTQMIRSENSQLWKIRNTILDDISTSCALKSISECKKQEQTNQRCYKQMIVRKNLRSKKLEIRTRAENKFSYISFTYFR